jgi:hypothetical protein
MPDPTPSPTTTPAEPTGSTAPAGGTGSGTHIPPQDFQHGPAACHGTWHNPDCNGDPNKWAHSCKYVNGVCTCTHNP